LAQASLLAQHVNTLGICSFQLTGVKVVDHFSDKFKKSAYKRTTPIVPAERLTEAQKAVAAPIRALNPAAADTHDAAP